MTSLWRFLGPAWFSFHFYTHASCAISSIHSETFNSNRLAFCGSCGVMVAERIRQYRSIPFFLGGDELNTSANSSLSLLHVDGLIMTSPSMMFEQDLLCSLNGSFLCDALPCLLTYLCPKLRTFGNDIILAGSHVLFLPAVFPPARFH